MKNKATTNISNNTKAVKRASTASVLPKKPPKIPAPKFKTGVTGDGIKPLIKKPVTLASVKSKGNGSYTSPYRYAITDDQVSKAFSEKKKRKPGMLIFTSTLCAMAALGVAITVPVTLTTQGSIVDVVPEPQPPVEQPGDPKPPVVEQPDTDNNKPVNPNPDQKPVEPQPPVEPEPEKPVDPKPPVVEPEKPQPPVEPEKPVDPKPPVVEPEKPQPPVDPKPPVVEPERPQPPVKPESVVTQSDFNAAVNAFEADLSKPLLKQSTITGNRINFDNIGQFINTFHDISSTNKSIEFSTDKAKVKVTVDSIKPTFQLPYFPDPSQPDPGYDPRPTGIQVTYTIESIGKTDSPSAYTETKTREFSGFANEHEYLEIRIQEVASEVRLNVKPQPAQVHYLFTQKPTIIRTHQDFYNFFEVPHIPGFEIGLQKISYFSYNAGGDINSIRFRFSLISTEDRTVSTMVTVEFTRLFMSFSMTKFDKYLDSLPRAYKTTDGMFNLREFDWIKWTLNPGGSGTNQDRIFNFASEKNRKLLAKNVLDRAALFLNTTKVKLPADNSNGQKPATEVVLFEHLKSMATSLIPTGWHYDWSLNVDWNYLKSRGWSYLFYDYMMSPERAQLSRWRPNITLRISNDLLPSWQYSYNFELFNRTDW